MTRVLFDGWALAYAPGSPAALHLLGLLDVLANDVEPLVALPAPSLHALRAEHVLSPAQDQPAGQLAWEQRRLPMLARETRAAVLHLTSLHPPVNAGTAVVISPAEAAQPWRGGGLAARLRAALAGGLVGSTALLWSEDLPAPEGGKVYRLPPVASLPETDGESYEPGYVLAHGVEHPDALRALLNGWSWAAGAVGEVAPLVLAGLNQAQRAGAAALAAQGDFGETVRLADEALNWRALYQNAALVVRTGAALPWGDPLSLALAAGKPVVAVEDAYTAARVGAAAYLTPPGDDRALGAALVTLVVETEMADALGEAAAQRAAQWNSAAFGARLSEVYRAVSAA